MQTSIEKALDGYITAMLWSSVDTHPETGEDLDNLEKFELSEESEQIALKVVIDFINDNLNDCILYAEQRITNGYDVWKCLGHDLWLTSDGHGAGFWDRGLDELGDRLSEASKNYSKDVHLGDDLKVHLS